MSKDPSFPFYAQDFLVGTMELTLEEIGAYVKLLAIQWAKGKIPKKRLGFFLGSDWEKVWPSIKDKFIDDGEFLYNQRLEEVREKRELFKQRQSDNGKKGGRPKKPKPNNNPKESQLKPNKKPLESENENEIENNKGGDCQEGEFFENVEQIEEDPMRQHFSDKFQSDEFWDTWALWKQFRKEQHKYKFKSDRVETYTLNNLHDMANGDERVAVKIIMQSIQSGWKGFFHLNTEKNGKSTGKQTRSERMAEALGIKKEHRA